MDNFQSEMKDVKIQVIGNGNAFGELNKFHTCFYLDTNQTKCLVDIGATSVYNLQQNRIDFNNIDIIILSHFHGDHFGGIPFFLLNSYFLLNRSRPLTIVGPQDCENRIKNLVNAVYPGLMEFFCEMDITFVEYDYSSSCRFQDLEIKGYPVIHSPESNPHGVRITIGERIFCYSGDTEWTDNLYQLCENADMFICECNYFEKEVRGHLSYLVLKEKLDLCTAKKLLLTHYGENLVNHLSEISIELTQQDKTYLI